VVAVSATRAAAALERTGRNALWAQRIHSSVLATLEILPSAQMDLGKYRRDRFARIPRISRSGGVLRVHSRSQIPRTRAYFERFSTMSEKSRDWLVERVEFELAGDFSKGQ
jgi:hypothetical protein